MNCLHIAGIVQQNGITLHAVHIRFWEVSAECRLILQKIWEENLWTEAAVHLIVGVCIIQILLCLWMALSALKKRLINHLHVYVGGTYCNNTCSSINNLENDNHSCAEPKSHTASYICVTGSKNQTQKTFPVNKWIFDHLFSFNQSPTWWELFLFLLNGLLLLLIWECPHPQPIIFQTEIFQLCQLNWNVALQGSVAITGAAVKWLRDNLNVISKASEIGKIDMTT